MAGELTPLVLLPRYTTYAGASDFVTIAMDVSDYQKAIINLWRGILLGGSPTITFSCEESTDQVFWTPCAGTNVTAFDPGQADEKQATATLAKRWFRLKVALTGSSPGPAATCWAVGFLEQRES